MKIFRQGFVRRTFSIFTLLIILNGIFYPTASYALTSAQFQPEYTSYEDGASTDLVNLLTGDFNFTTPILSVPIREEASFDVPLSYHAGISNEQEASWVGLGWNLNVGAITRSINGFPDDANGESQTLNVKDLSGRRGWYLHVLAGAAGWDNLEGHYGALTFSAMNMQWNRDGSTVGIAGIYIGKDARVDALEHLGTALRVAAAILTWGTAAFAYNIAFDVASSVTSQAMFTSTFESPQGLSVQGHWSYKKREEGVLGGLLYTNYWYWLDETKVEDMYGVLNLHKAPSSLATTEMNQPSFLKLRKNVLGNADDNLNAFSSSDGSINRGAASDISIDLSGSEEYEIRKHPSLLAYDNFRVYGPEISGDIRPFRYEIGSVAVQREQKGFHTRFNPVPFLDYGLNKVPFGYSGSTSNKHLHQLGNSSTSTSRPYYYGLDATVIPSGQPPSSFNNNTLRLDMNDVAFHNQRLSTDLTTRTRLPQDRNIEWLTNSNIKYNANRYDSSLFLDYFTGADRTNFRTFHPFGGSNFYYGSTITPGSPTSTITLMANSSMPATLNGSTGVVYVVRTQTDAEGSPYTETISQTNVTFSNITSTSVKVNVTNIAMNPATDYFEISTTVSNKSGAGIGGFVVTSADGMNYHYALPIHDYSLVGKTTDKYDANRNSTISRSGAFANTWLLTGITGPDFIDRGGPNNSGNGIIDEADWGYWVKFNYGRHSHNYSWRTPYAQNTTIPSSNDQSVTYVQGKKEKYYLNAIETPSHVALFLKGPRKDAKDASAQKLPSLRLNEIILLTRGEYKKIIDPAGAYQLPASTGKIDVMYVNQTGTDHDDYVMGSTLAYAKSVCLRDIVFNYDEAYPLCMGASNSDAGFGKLTLKSFTVMGRNSTKVMPDYKFDYGNNNPNYNANKWDGWGMFSSSGASVGITHKTSTVNADGAAWSLVSITTPLGHKIDVEYERDTYGSISGEPVSTRQVDPSFINGERITVGQYEVATCTDIVECVDAGGSYPCPQPVDYNVHHVSVMATIVNGVPVLDQPLPPPVNHYDDCSNSGQVPTTVVGPLYYKIVQDKLGGDIRVKSLTMRDPFTNISYKTRYIYTTDTYPGSSSSGVVSMEPDYIRTSDNDYPFYSSLGYPMTPVVYGKVAIVTGKLTNDGDFTSKQVYEFETPHASRYGVEQTAHKNNTLLYSHSSDPYSQNPSYYAIDRAIFTQHEITSRLSRVGKLISIKLFDRATNPNSGTPISSTVFEYTETPTNSGVVGNQGVFTEGTLRSELIQRITAANQYRFHKLDRTTLVSFPYVLSKVTSTRDGFETTQTFMNWDLLSGEPVEIHSKDPLGYRTKVVREPLYRASNSYYSELGSKAISISNRNMLSQDAAVYEYQIDDNGKELGLLNASATVWSKEWSNYRKLNTSNVFVDDYDADDINANNAVEPNEITRQKVWRKSAMYSVDGSMSSLTSAGTLNFNYNTSKFNFANPSNNPLWTKLTTIKRYDHHSQPLEIIDPFNIYSSSKLAHDGNALLAMAINSQFEEMTFCGAESMLNTNFFDGEVYKGASATVVNSPVHSGKKSLSLSSGYGFTFKSTNVVAGKKYRASVWTSDQTNGKIYYQITSNSVPGSVTTTGSTVTKAVALLNGTTWYRVDMIIDIPSNAITPQIEVGVTKTGGAAVIFDDFRFQPFDSNMTGYVYDPVSLQIEYEFDNTNVFTRYQYDETGAIEKKFSETITYGEKLVLDNASGFRRFNVDQ